MFKRLCVIPLLLISVQAFAEMPYINNNTAESRERVQSGDMTCETSKAQTTINAGVYGSNSQHYGFDEGDKGGYVGISIPIGGDDKVDCNRLYDLVVKEKELKIKELEKRIESMQQRVLSVEK